MAMKHTEDGARTARQRLLDRSFDVLSDRHRRRVLEQLAALPADRDSVAVAALTASADDPERARITLRHRHLPKLAAAGYVEWDRTRQVLRPGERFEEVEALLRLLSDDWNAGSREQS